MIPRSQRILFWTLLVASVLMAAVLIRLRERASERISGRYAAADPSLLLGPSAVPEESVTLLEADDSDGSIGPVARKLALPQESGARARVLLRRLLADYAAPESKHPLATGLGVEQVFFMPGSAGERSTDSQGPAPEQTVIVNLARTFAENHPSGIEVETLTLLSLIGTIHENFPAVSRVRFLVDGQPRESLAGHADLTRVYLADSIASRRE